MGVPAALTEPPGTRRAMQAIARLQGCERASFAPSTLHLFWDLFGLLAREAVAIYMDDGLYPIARWGIERAAARGVPVRSFPHHDADALDRLLRQTARTRVRPLIVTDGFSPGSGKPAPLVSYLESARSFGGYLIMDDTQALGIFGHTPNAGAPYGLGGGGMLRLAGISDPNVMVVSSLAKGFGVPVAVLSGSRAIVEYFEEQSDTRVHCSPPSVVHLRAVEHALSINDREGDELRSRLSQLVGYFRRRLAAIDFSFTGGLFPVQTLVNAARLDLPRLHERLLQLGIKTVLHSHRPRGQAGLSFIITALHALCQIDAAVSAFVQATTFQTRWRTATTQFHPTLSRGAS